MPQQKVVIKIPSDLKPNDRELLADVVIDFIVNRTNEKGRDKNGQKFQKYSKEYAKEKGVSQTSVNLELTGEMLSKLKLLKHRAGSMTIGYDDDKVQGKVEGNRKGTYGNKKAVTKPRDFLGISQNALTNILKGFDDD